MSKKLSNTSIIRHNSIKQNTESLLTLKSLGQTLKINNRLKCHKYRKGKGHKFGLLIGMLLLIHQNIS